MPRTDPEISAYARRMNREEEVDDINAFIDVYPRATGETLDLVDTQESPDAVCTRPDGTLIGIEHTRLRRSPDEAHWDSIFHQREDMDIRSALNDMEALILKKMERRPKYKPDRCILLIAIYEAEFDTLARVAAGTMNWLDETGFEEIWLGDFASIRDGAHRELRLFGLFPEELSFFSERSMFDQKPYGVMRLSAAGNPVAQLPCGRSAS
jgi:hypothetical protein